MKDFLTDLGRSPTNYVMGNIPMNSNCRGQQISLEGLPMFIDSWISCSDSSLAVPMFQQGEDPIECINKAMTFLSAVASRFPPSNNQIRTSSNPRNQATIQDGRVIVQQCTQPKRPRNAARFKEKLMLAEAQEAGQILDEEQLAFLAIPGLSEALVAQQTIPQNSAFQTKDLDAYDLDCDDLSSAKAVLMTNLSSCDPEVLSEVPYSDSYLNDMINQDVQEM
ncbi:hypothetical protein Tco_0608766 [Tanacetum coccineum]